MKLPPIHKRKAKVRTCSVFNTFDHPAEKRPPECTYQDSLNSIIAKCSKFEAKKLPNGHSGKFKELAQKLERILSFATAGPEERHRRQHSITRSNRKTTRLLLSDAQVLKTELDGVVIKDKKVWTSPKQKYKIKIID